MSKATVFFFLIGGASASMAAVSFETEVKPIFEKHCVECHGPKKQRSEFRLDDREVALHGRDNHAPNIIPGKPGESPLIRFVTPSVRPCSPYPACALAPSVPTPTTPAARPSATAPPAP